VTRLVVDYRDFSRNEAQGNSPTYARLALAVAASETLLSLIDQLPAGKRQPNLVFGAARSQGAPVDPADAFVEWVIRHWSEVAAVCQARSTQTNEARRQATLLPVLAQIPGPIALLEVGASAGLCLYPDRWRYRYGDAEIGYAARPLLTCEPIGTFTPPTVLPDVVWRAGIDLNPLNVSDPEDVRWLENLIWPEQSDRLTTLHAAVDIARADPPHLVAGDLNERLVELAESAPTDATLAVLAYLSSPERDEFVAQVQGLRGHWISNEAPHVIDEIASRAPARRRTPGHPFLTALDGHPVARSGPHGQSIELIPSMRAT
jgi:hypothetical protein